MQYDVIIVGGGTSGCAAAYILGMNGIKTLLVEKNVHLGGSITSALVVPAMKSSENQINTLFFNALIDELKNLNAQVTYIDNNEGWFNPELTKIALDRLMAKSNVDVRFNTTISNVTLHNEAISGVTISSNMLSEYIAAEYIIDASGNCEIGVLSNCEFLENFSKQQPTTLRFIMSGVDLNVFSKWIMDFDSDRNVTTSAIIGSQVHLSTAYTWDSNANWALKPLFDDAVNNNILKNEDRNYFQIFTVPGMPSAVAFNCPRIYFPNDINPMSPEDSSKALRMGREAIVRLANFCKIYLPGFDKSYISNIADMLGIRVSRRIRGKYVYTVADLRSGKKFETPVVVSNYPIDVHSNIDNQSVLEHSVLEYQLPIESLMSNDVKNLFVTGRCISADFYAQAALRIQPSCFSMGEGVANYITELLNNLR